MQYLHPPYLPSCSLLINKLVFKLLYLSPAAPARPLPTPLPYITLPCLTLPYLTLHYLILPYLTLPYLTLYLTLPYLTLPYLTLYTLPNLTLPYLYLTLPYLIPYLTLPRPKFSCHIHSYLCPPPVCYSSPHLTSPHPSPTHHLPIFLLFYDIDTTHLSLFFVRLPRAHRPTYPCLSC